MKSMWNELSDYVFSILGQEIEISPWKSEKSLPRYLTDLYQFKQIQIFERRYVLASPGAGENQTPAAIRKHFDKIMDVANCEVAFVHSSIANWNRKRFIEQNISFIIPGNQMYLPMLGLDLREYIRIPIKQNNAKKLTPSAQVIALKVLAHGEKTEWTGAELAAEIGVTLMTVLRAFDELKPCDAFEIGMSGKRKVLALKKNRREAWDALQPGLSSPIVQRIFIPQNDVPVFASYAGISVLAKTTSINEPELPEYAVNQAQWKIWIKKHPVRSMPVADVGTAVLEMWRYEPSNCKNGGMTDILSVCLTLRESDDDRVQQAIEQALKEALW